MEQWDAWMASDLTGAQLVLRNACAAGEPALAEGLAAKGGFSCNTTDALEGVSMLCLFVSNATLSRKQFNRALN